MRTHWSATGSFLRSQMTPRSIQKPKTSGTSEKMIQKIPFSIQLATDSKSSENLLEIHPVRFAKESLQQRHHVGKLEISVLIVILFLILFPLKMPSFGSLR